MHSMDKAKRKATMVVAAAAAGIALASLPEGALAATGADFDTVWTMLVDWIGGTLGKIIAITFIIVGVVAGIAKGSIFGLVTGIGLGIALITAPTVLDNMFGATLPIEPTAAVQTVTTPPAVPLAIPPAVLVAEVVPAT